MYREVNFSAATRVTQKPNNKKKNCRSSTNSHACERRSKNGKWFAGGADAIEKAAGGENSFDFDFDLGLGSELRDEEPSGAADGGHAVGSIELEGTTCGRSDAEEELPSASAASAASADNDMELDTVSLACMF